MPSLKHWCIAIGSSVLEMAPLVLRGYFKYRTRLSLNRCMQRRRVATPMSLQHIVQLTRSRLEQPLAVPGGQATMPPPGRFRGRRIIVYHEASNAHVEMYIYDPRTGTAHNMGVRVLSVDEQALIRKNNQGWLTETSKDTVKAIFAQKAAGREFIGISTDHRLREARASWNRPEDGPGPGEYGHGPHREVISDIEVDVYSNGSTVEWVDWELNPGDPIYVHVVFPQGDSRNGTVGVIGFRARPEPQFEDRLHLVSDKQDSARFRRNIGMDGHASEKIDGASCHFRIDKNGARYYSPRHSVATGRRIEYTYKLGQLQDVTSDETIVGMGELVFVDTGTNRTLSSNEIGGVLNADRLPDSNLEPRLYIYRIDRMGKQDLMTEPYWEQNRPRCAQIARKHEWYQVPAEVSMNDLGSTMDREGVVGVPAGQPITAGRKLKWREDGRDVVVLEVAFQEGPSGKVAGVVWYEDPATGRKFKTASGWTEAQKREMMADPGSYEGQVMRIEGFNGHGSRAAKFGGWHADRDAHDVRSDPRLKSAA